MLLLLACDSTMIRGHARTRNFWGCMDHAGRCNILYCMVSVALRKLGLIHGHIAELAGVKKAVFQWMNTFLQDLSGQQVLQYAAGVAALCKDAFQQDDANYVRWIPWLGSCLQSHAFACMHAPAACAISCMHACSCECLKACRVARQARSWNKFGVWQALLIVTVLMTQR